LSHESDQAQQVLSKNAIKSVLYFIRTCVKCVCARVLRVLDFFCILLLIAHFSVIVSSFEFAAADDETQDNFATPCAPCLKKPSQILPHCCMPCTCYCSHCTIIFISNNNFIVCPHYHHSHLKHIIIMPYVNKAEQGTLGEDLAIKGKEKAITSFFQVEPKPPKPLPKYKQGRPWKTSPPQLSPSKRAKS
jgi:hypothetical protein